MRETYQQQQHRASGRESRRDPGSDHDQGLGPHGRHQGRSGFQRERPRFDPDQDDGYQGSGYSGDRDYDSSQQGYPDDDYRGDSRGATQRNYSDDDPRESQGRWRDSARRRQHDPRFGDWYAGDQGRRSGRHYAQTHGPDAGMQPEPYEPYPGVASGPSGWAGAGGLDASVGKYQGFRNYGRGRHAGRGPKGYTRSDERICEDVCERLMEADEIDASEISVEVKDGVVHLSGRVDERWMKHRSEDIADGCGGVKDVRNELRVAGRNNGDSGEDAVEARRREDSGKSTSAASGRSTRASAQNH